MIKKVGVAAVGALLPVLVAEVLMFGGAGMVGDNPRPVGAALKVPDHPLQIGG